MMIVQVSLPGWQGVVALVILTPLLGLLSLAVYRLYLHPLRRFPGPRLWAISRVPYLYRHVTGKLPLRVFELHEQYGDVVRVAPDELAFSHPDAWHEIMGHKQASGQEFEKAQWFYKPIDDGPEHIVNTSRQEHGRLRRQMSHGFSDKSMREQEPLIRKYVDLLMHKLAENCEDGRKALVMSDWYNFCTFDIIGDLAFGEPFGCLESSHYHSWIKGIFETARYGTVLQALKFVPPLRKLLFSMIPKKLLARRSEHKRRTREKLQRRLQIDHERPDLIEGLLRRSDELKLGLDELVGNAEIMIVAGSETTATLLSGVTYYLLTNPECLRRVTEEVRSTFESEADIDLISVGQLSYMLACLNESMRLYPPIANGLPRVVPADGAKILGEAIPAKTIVAVHHWPLYHRKKFWVDAAHFHPERFLGDARFATDRRDALQPFQVGPRNCLGRNLAYSEMRLILARILFKFDLRIAEESLAWNDQRCYIFWQKGPLKVYLSHRPDSRSNIK